MWVARPPERRFWLVERVEQRGDALLPIKRKAHCLMGLWVDLRVDALDAFDGTERKHGAARHRVEEQEGADEVTLQDRDEQLLDILASPDEGALELWYDDLAAVCLPNDRQQVLRVRLRCLDGGHDVTFPLGHRQHVAADSHIARHKVMKE